MRPLGFALLAIGLVVFAFGLSSSQALTEQVVEGVSGRYTDTTMWYILGGIGLILGGSIFAFGGKK